MTGVPVTGAAAPDFDLPSHWGEVLAPADLLAGDERGPGAPARSALLVFYPFAFSPVCGDELGELATRSPDFSAAGCAIAGVSCDAKFTLAAWAERLGVDFPLLSDFWPHGAASRAYGCFDEERGMALRGTFLVDADGALVEAQVLPAGTRRDFGPWLERARSLRE